VKYVYGALAFIGGFLGVLFCYWIDTALAPEPVKPQTVPEVKTKIVYVEVPVEKEPPKKPPEKDTEEYKRIKELFEMLNVPKKKLQYDGKPFKPYYLDHLRYSSFNKGRWYQVGFESLSQRSAFRSIYARLTYAKKVDIYTAFLGEPHHYTSFEQFMQQNSTLFWWMHQTFDIAATAIYLPEFCYFQEGAYLWFTLDQNTTVQWVGINADWNLSYSIRNGNPFYMVKEEIKALLQYEIDVWLSDMIYRLVLEGFYHFVMAMYMNNTELQGYILVCSDKNVQHTVVFVEYRSTMLGEKMEKKCPYFYVFWPLKKGV